MMKTQIFLALVIVSAVVLWENHLFPSEKIHSIVDAWVCPSCGHDNGEDVMHCKICGRYK